MAAMSFASPYLLAGLVFVPLLLVAYVAIDRRARRASRRHVAAPLRPAVLPRGVGWRRHVPIAGALAAVALLLAALAKPQTTVAVPVEHARVEVLTDRSGSMLAKDVSPDRLTAARAAAEDFLKAVPDGVRVGAITFNQTPTVLASPTTDHQAVTDAVKTITAAGTTATGDALAAALKQLAGDTSPAAVVLLSDGKSVRGQDVLAVARQAKAKKIPIYTVSLGTASGTITTKTGISKVPPDTATMQQVAQITGGQSFAIGDAAQLRAVYEKLGSKLATEHRKQDVSSGFAGGALLVLLTGSLAGLGLTGRLI
jgi:Ca-activated chloride channel family protein